MCSAACGKRRLQVQCNLKRFFFPLFSYLWLCFPLMFFFIFPNKHRRRPLRWEAMVSGASETSRNLLWVFRLNARSAFPPLKLHKLLSSQTTTSRSESLKWFINWSLQLCFSMTESHMLPNINWNPLWLWVKLAAVCSCFKSVLSYDKDFILTLAR